MIEQGGLSLNGEKVVDIHAVVSASDFKDGAVVLKKGKKGFVKVTLGK